jgi:gamma-glutamylcyclotransferase (GGCT)/AIG2-like uncharacterized protein YtfP
MAVHGELYEVAGSMVTQLDEIEGAPSLFRLEPVEVEGMDREVFAYFYRQDTRGLPLCQDGRWRNRKDILPDSA